MDVAGERGVEPAGAPVAGGAVHQRGLVVGIVGYKNLAVDRFPNVDLPIVTVVTTLPGASP